MVTFARVIASAQKLARSSRPSLVSIVRSNGRALSSSGRNLNDVEGAAEGSSQFVVAGRTEPVRMMIPPLEDPLLHYFTSHIMHHGERHKASRITANMLAQIHRLTNAPPLPIFRHAIHLASPSVRIKSHKKSAKTFMVPMPLNDRQRTFFAVKWLLAASDSRSDHKLEDRLAKEVIRIIEGESDVLKRKMEVHKLAVANRSSAVVKPGR